MNGGLPTDSDKDVTRRDVLAAIPATLVTASAFDPSSGPGTRPRIAALVTEYRPKSHGQGIVDRFLDGYGWESRHYQPRVDVVSLYIDQKPPGDLSRERETRHPGLKIYSTVPEAVTRGTGRLDVDGVLLIGEHGHYPRNEKGQTLYPRYEFFEKLVEVFRRSGRAVPVFIDKHLSWNVNWARSMVETARKLDFPLMAGSSLPVTRRLPGVEVPLGTVVQEAVGVGYGGVDSYDFHGLEAIQCLIERRRGGETGVAAVQAIRGPSVWGALKSGSWDGGGCDLDLFESCLCRSFTMTSPRPGYGHVYPELGQLPDLVPDPVMYRLEYTDGVKATLLMLNGLVGDFTVALRLNGEAKILSTQFYLPGLSPGQTLPDFFSPLAHHIETMFLTGKSPYPVERTLLTTCVLATAIDSLANGRKRIETPYLRNLQYQAPAESTYWRS